MCDGHMWKTLQFGLHCTWSFQETMYRPCPDGYETQDVGIKYMDSNSHGIEKRQLQAYMAMHFQDNVPLCKMRAIEDDHLKILPKAEKSENQRGSAWNARLIAWNGY